MKERRLLVVLLLLMVLLVFSGCDMINQLLGIEDPADLVVKSVEPLKDGEELTGVRIVFANEGGEGVSGVKYAVVLSTDETVSITNDTVIYEDKVDIPADGEKQIDLDGETDMGPWMASHNVSLADGTYFIGAAIDTDDAVAEASETNNEGSSNISFTGGDNGGGGGSTSRTFTLNISGASDLYPDGDLLYLIVVNGGDPSNPIASGNAPIASDGTASAIALDINTNETWIGDSGTQYDLYIAIDMNGDGAYDGGYCDYSHSSPSTITMDDDGVTLSTTRGDFYREPLPATFGAYSENPDHPVYFEPDFWAQDCTADRTNTGEVTPLDGSYVIRVTFTGSGGSDNSAWMHFTYDPMNISNSSSFVFALEHGAPNTDFSIILTSNSTMYGLNNSISTYYTQTINGSWDIYSIPFTDFQTGFDPAKMDGFKIGQSNGSGDTYYFDDIHFE